MKIGGSLARSARSTCLVSGLVFLWPRQWGSSKTCPFFCHAVSLFCCIHVSCLEPLVFLCLQSGNGPKAFTLHTPVHPSLYLIKPHSPHSTHLTPCAPHFTRSPLLSSRSALLTFTLHALHFPSHTPHSTLYTPHSTLLTLHSTLYAAHSSYHTHNLQPPHSTTHPPHCNCREVCARLLKLTGVYCTCEQCHLASTTKMVKHGVSTSVHLYIDPSSSLCSMFTSWKGSIHHQWMVDALLTGVYAEVSL